MKDHSGVRDLMGLAAAGALNPQEQRRVEGHLRRCGECRAELNSWSRLAGALKDLPALYAPQALLLETRRLLEMHEAAGRDPRGNWFVLAFLGLFSLMVTLLNWRLVHWLEIRLAHRLDFSPTAAWVTFIGVTWLTTALAAGLIARHARRQEKII